MPEKEAMMVELAAEPKLNTAQRWTQMILENANANPGVLRTFGASCVIALADLIKNNIVEIRLVRPNSKSADAPKVTYGFRSVRLKRADICRSRNCEQRQLAVGEMGWWRVIEGGPQHQDDGPYHAKCAKEVS